MENTASEPLPEFDLDERVIIKKYMQREAYVRYRFWHFKNQAHCYLLTIDGKKATRRYYANELLPFGADFQKDSV